MLTANIATRDAAENTEKLNEQLRAVLHKDLEALMIKMQSHVKSDKLSGQVLHRRTGTLSRSVHYEIENTAQALVGRLTTGREAPYGRVHEFGLTVTVPAHSRTITFAFGRKIDPVTFQVKQYQADYPERSFMRTTLDEFRQPFKQMVIAALTKVEAS